MTPVRPPLQFVNNGGFDCERHLYRCLFEALLNTSAKDSNRLTLLQQLYSDLGDLFERPNFTSLLRYALEPVLVHDDEISQDQPAQSSARQSQSKQSSAIAFSAYSCSPTSADVNQFRERLALLFKCLPDFNELQKLAICFCFDLLDLEGLVDLNQCTYTSNCLLSHFILTQLNTVQDDSRAANIAKAIKEGKQF